MTSCYRSWAVVLTVAVGTFFALTAGAYAATSSGGMMVNAGGQPLGLASSRTTTDGQLQNTYTVGAAHATVTAPRGSTVTFGNGTMQIVPPLAAAGTATAARAEHLKTAKGGPSAHAAWTNPCDHCWYNALSGSYCNGTCVYAGSEQYAIQEVSGEWFMGQYINGTVYPGSTSATLGEAYNRFPGESGDSGPINYKPGGDDCPSSSTTWSWSFSYAGFSFGLSGPLAGGSCYGPIAPSSWGDPAFGSRWWSGGESGNHAIASFDAIHLGAGQDPYDVLVLGAS
jgi:hypothetical protein